MSKICIGIHCYEQPEALQATLDSVRQHTGMAFELILLPDGPDLKTQHALRSIDGIRQLPGERPMGAPACFNRLAAASDAEILVLLESGCITGPGWLGHLLAALSAQPHHGLAGPSTNRSWNEQGVFRTARGSPRDVQATAAEAVQRFGAAWRTLEPLYSLADFCYVVQRRVIDAIGAADEGYSLGPCWEMDYNIRAASAGFAGVWACAAYVYRPPAAPRRKLEETRRFVASKQLYQDKFCALHLRGERTDYEPHCRGADCEHFAPPSLIQLAIPLPALPATTPGSSATTPPQAAPPDVGLVRPTIVAAAGNGNAQHRVANCPLVSCIMPTANRLDYVRQSIKTLVRQDYANWELIIIDDGEEDLAPLLPKDNRIQHFRVAKGTSIGTKRNWACKRAAGDIIAHWDDDDWYGYGRLAAQVAPILAGDADITALNDTVFFELDRWVFWRASPELHRRMFAENVHGGTLVYRRDVWRRNGGFADRSLAEDAVFLRQAMRGGARLGRVSGIGHFIYLRHERNSWSFKCGEFLDASGWHRIDEPELPVQDRAFFAAHSRASSSSEQAPPHDPIGQEKPLVTCIMPTANRPHFVPQTIRCFQRQTYANRELVIVDDGLDSIANFIPQDPRIRYIRLPHRLSVGAKRNLACEHANGSIIVHWDDDDWMAPWRLDYQASCLLANDADVCGLDTILYYDPASRQAWLYRYPARGKAWIGGNTLCYRKRFWHENRFPDVNVGEDNGFIGSARCKRVIALPNRSFIVALIHRDNVSPKRTTGTHWHHHDVQEVHELMGDDEAFYATFQHA